MSVRFVPSGNIPLSSTVPLVASTATNGISLTQQITGATAANPIAIGFRNGLTITGNMSLVTGSTDLLSGNFTTTYSSVTAGPVTTSGAFQAGIYIDSSNTPGVTFNGVRGYVMHAQVDAAVTVNLLKGLELQLTNNAGTITSIRWIDVPDTGTTPGGGSITNEWCLYSPGINAKLEVASLGRVGRLDVTGTSSGGAVNGFYLPASGFTMRAASTDVMRSDASKITMLVPVKLANAYVNTPVTTTGSVTVQDSTGTTYRLACAV